MRLKTCSQNAEMNQNKVQSHSFDTSFLKTYKTGDGTKHEKICWLSNLTL